jgi:flagellar basal-body rod protein FlgG
VSAAQLTVTAEFRLSRIRIGYESPGGEMSGLVESALAILSGSAHRTRVASENVGNMMTPGYKARVAFPSLPGESLSGVDAQGSEIVKFAQGAMRSTGNALDLAIEGSGFFVVATDQGQLLYTRQGHFQRDSDGRIVTAGGHALQQVGGGDLIVESARPEITADGTVLAEGRPIGRIALATAQTPSQLTAVSGSMFAASDANMVEAESAGIRQGMLEGSNVALGDEMLALMGATRQAETGARLVQVYDELMGRAFTTLGQRG